MLDSIEENVFEAIKNVVLVEANKNYGGCKFASNYLRSLGSDDVKLEMFRRIMSDNLDSRIWNARPAFSKSDKIDLTEEVGTLLSENYKQAKDAVKDKSFNIANLMSTSLKVAIENKSNKKQKLIAARQN